MNILIHYYRLGHYIGGAEVVALNQCSEILRQGHNVTILTADTATPTQQDIYGFCECATRVQTRPIQGITQFLSQNRRTKSSCKNAGTRNRTAGAQHRRIQTDISAIQSTKEI